MKKLYNETVTDTSNNTENTTNSTNTNNDCTLDNYGDKIEDKRAKAMVDFIKEYNNRLDPKKSLDTNIRNFMALSEKDGEKMKTLSETRKHRLYYSNIRYSKCKDDEKRRYLENRYDVPVMVADSIKVKHGDISNLGEVFQWYITNPSYANIPKIQRKAMYSCTGDKRPTGELAYETWNGFQVLDLDIKNRIIAQYMKGQLFKILSKNIWFVGITLSTSGNGIHIWTKIEPMSQKENRKVEYIINYRQKFSTVYTALENIAYRMHEQKYIQDLLKDNIISETDIDFEVMKDWIDMAMCKPQQATFIPYDPEAEFSTNFTNASLDTNFDTIIDGEMGEIDWMERKDLTVIFDRYQFFTDPSSNKEYDIELDEDEVFDPTNGKKSSTSTARHYKHWQRWQLANTLCSIYGATKGYQLLREVCSSKTSDRELMGDIRTANTYKKPVSTWAITELDRVHGFNIKIKTNDEEVNNILLSQTSNTLDESNSPTHLLNPETKVIDMTLSCDQFLSDIQDNIFKNLDLLNLLESGAGTGKTEMVKHLTGRVCLLEPFTSILEQKIEKDEDIIANWLTFWGNKQVGPSDWVSEKSFAMTFDKFANLNICNFINEGFEYIVIDESHLLFTSAYRDCMAPIIKRIMNLAQNGITIILMTGTPTGEMMFMPYARHIRVRKEDNRIKNFTVVKSHSKDECTLNMCKDMATAITQGKRILYPTNRGNLYVSQIFGLVQQQLNDIHFGRSINTFYYKKANSGMKSMDDIAESKTFGNNDIIACTNFLSVGVDICDKYNFEVFFDDLMMPQDVEQFTNRIRNNNLYIRLYVPKVDHVGLPIDYTKIKPLQMMVDEFERIRLFNICRTCNEVIERNGVEARYNDLTVALSHSNNCIIFDEYKNRYYIDQTAYKLHLFQDLYSEYISQLPIITRSMKYYGYEVFVEDRTNVMDDVQRDDFKEILKKAKGTETNRQTVETNALLDSLTPSNIDIYNDIAKGNFDIIRNDKYKEDRLNNNILATDVEIITRNMPYINTFYKFYDIDTIRTIYDACTDVKSNRIVKSKLERIRKFVAMEIRRLNNKVDIPMYDFYKQSYDFAVNNSVTNKHDIDMFISKFCCSYCNSINGIVVQKDKDINGKDTGSQKYLRNVNDIMTNIFWTIVEKGKVSKKNNTINIRPFELLWKRKESVNNICEDKNLKAILMDDLIKIRGQKFENEIDDTDMANLSIETTKKLLNYKHTKDTIKAKHITPRDIPVEYSISTAKDYDTFAKEDSSNERFIIWQKNQYEAIKNSVNMAALLKENELNSQNNIINSVVGGQKSLFDNTVDKLDDKINTQCNNVAHKTNSNNTSNAITTSQKTERTIAEILDISSNDEYASDYLDMDKFDSLLGEDGMCPF